MREFIYSYRIPLSDTDAGGIVYHSNYIAIAERARMEMLRDIGMERMVLDAEEISVEYKRPGIFDDLVIVHSTVSVIDDRRCVVSQIAVRGDDTLAELQVKAVLRSLPDLEEVPVPHELTEA